MGASQWAFDAQNPWFSMQNMPGASTTAPPVTANPVTTAPPGTGYETPNIPGYSDIGAPPSMPAIGGVQGLPQAPGGVLSNLPKASGGIAPIGGMPGGNNNAWNYQNELDKYLALPGIQGSKGQEFPDWNKNWNGTPSDENMWDQTKLELLYSMQYDPEAQTQLLQLFSGDQAAMNRFINANMMGGGGGIDHPEIRAAMQAKYRQTPAWAQAIYNKQGV